MVHRREIDGQEVVFGNQGDLWLNAMTWFDHDTGSVWSQPTGEAIMGPRAGERLELMPSTLTTWADWQDRFPDTGALDVSTRTSNFRLHRQAVVVVVGSDSLAVTIGDLRDVGVVNETVGGVPVAIVMPEGTERPVVWSRRIGDRTVDLALDAAGLIDTESSLRFDPVRGVSDDGDQLDVLPSFSSFPSDYARIWPDGRVWRPTGAITALRYSDAPPA